MPDMKWIKLDTDIFDNRKIKQIEKMPKGDTIVLIWLKLLALAGRINSGTLYLSDDLPYTADMLAAEFGRPADVVKTAMEIFLRFGMVDMAMDVYHICNWEKHQSDMGADRVREQWRQRTANARERKRAGNAYSERDMSRDNSVTCHENVTPRDGDNSVTVTQCHAVEEDREKEKERDINNNNNNTFLSDVNTNNLKTEKAIINNNNIYGIEQTIDGYTDSEELRRALRDFAKFRAGLRKPVGAGTMKYIARRLGQIAGTDEEKIEIINTSIANGWAGIFPKDAGKARGGNTNGGAQAGGYSQREVTEDEFGADFYADVMNRKRDGATG